MPKRILYLFILAALTGCYKDKGNYTYTELPAFYVDTNTVQGEFIVPQYDTLRLNPGLVYEGNRAALKFSWTTYLYGSSINTIADTLARTEILAAPIALFPERYWLEFTATDTLTGRRMAYRYLMTVEGIGSGMMVLYEKDNRVDFDLIKTRLLEGLLEKDEVVRNLYTISNPGHPLTGKAVAINMFRFQTAQYISVFSENDGVQISPADMGIIKNFNEQFAASPDLVRPQGQFAPFGLTVNDFENSSGFDLLVNGGQAYANMVLFAFGKPTAYSLLFASDGDYEAAPFIKYGLARIVVYDQKNRRFLGASPLGTTLTPIISNGSAFNFQSVGKDMVYMDYGYGGTYMNYAVFKEPVDDGRRYLYVVDLGASAARYAWDISAYPGISSATKFAYGTRGQLMYYAAGNKLYQIHFDLSAGQELGATEAWPFIPPNEEITCLKMCPHPGRNLAENAKDKYLFVGTWDATANKGKVYVLQANVTSGVLTAEPAAVFEGFGKVKDLAFKF
ncbi:MAG: PKD-like family lipoprotein [Candidatus Pseudobacter hemicellulosilyticus]|uniref:PKD-like family lipoprotein n=1 Tax=Candidatus Pseudobacter hemicellulosilyticus TaxID=3121375 RepID=A0AAJ5WSS4_9BACT|nr:MAG: PKD-like family lipoprotein [Pseudobacter sp.]